MTSEVRSGPGVPRVPVALPPGAATLLGSPRTGGLVWAGGYASVGEAIVALIRRALATDEADQEPGTR